MKHLHRYLFALTVVLAALKLTLWRTLSWWWVFAPIYAPIAFTLALIILAIIVAMLFGGKNAGELEDLETE